jgi:signal peptidase II
MATRTYRWLLFGLAVAGFTADQATKYGIFNWLYVEGRLIGEREIIPGAFKLLVQYDPFTPPNCDCSLVKWNGPIPPRVNHGALFSLGGEHGGMANKFFTSVSVLAAAGITIWGLRKKTAQDRWLCLSLGLILGGTLGNLFDRVVFGGVRDFLYFYLIDWPVFNVADSCLVVGALLLLGQAVLGKSKDEPAATPATAEANPPTPTPPAAG